MEGDVCSLKSLISSESSEEVRECSGDIQDRRGVVACLKHAKMFRVEGNDEGEKHRVGGSEREQ